MHWQLLTVVLVVAAPAPPEKEKKDEEKMQGTWLVVSMVREGTSAADAEFKNVKVTIKDDVLAVKDGDKDEQVTIKLDPTKTPKTIDMATKNKPMAEQISGIYELKGDDLKICFAKGGGARPTEFASKPGSNDALIVLKREKQTK
jgi:uncharacterized protein (TIGR03067 family)